MNFNPAEFDPSSELEHFHNDEQELFSLPLQTYFYLVETSRQIEAFAAPAFTIEPVLNPKDNTLIGCAVGFVVRSRAFLVDTGTRVRLWASSPDEPESDDRRLIFDGEASDPKAWDGLLKEIGRVEHFHVFIPHADKLRQMWTQFLAERQRRDDERGY